MANLSSITRREFMKFVAVGAGSAAYGCAHTPEVPEPAIKEEPFTYDVRTQANPNYEGKMYPFHEVILKSNSTPGVEFPCKPGTPMVASVQGQVFDINYGAHGPSSGYTVMTGTQPEDKGRKFPYWNTFYGHLDKNLAVKKGDRVERGQIIGYVHSVLSTYGITAKLMAREAPNGNGTEYFLNPDNYGIGYGYLDYWDGKTDLFVPTYIDRALRQQAIIKDLIRMSNSNQAQSLPKKKHYAGIPYSIAEQIKYMQQMHKQRPEAFGKNSEEAGILIKEFYEIQPIKLTLPFKKP